MGATGKDNLDLTFFTNEGDDSLLERFRRVLKHTRYFDVLVGYFRASGFYNLYRSLEDVEKIRVIVGLKLDEHTWDIYRHAREGAPLEFRSSHKIREQYRNELRDDVQATDDNLETDTGIRKFIDYIKSGKLEMRVYPDQPIHAKVYIMRKPEGSEDFGRVITGSSNFSFSGLSENLEFNVELKQGYDVRFALDKFEQLWAQSIDITEDFVSTVDQETWVNDSITPYELYLKFLYEYFKLDLSYDLDLIKDRLPEGFLDLEYQKQAVVNALRIIDEHGGVFISDVVGLGKTYISAMVAGQLDGHTLVISSPVLLDENNPGSWPNVMRDFNVPTQCLSVGKLDSIDHNRLKRIKNVIIDEAHAFRNQTNKTYEQLASICHGKRVILVTATPYNNRPEDLLSQIRIFQKGKQSTIPGLPNLEKFFSEMEGKIDRELRETDYPAFLEQLREVSSEIRNRVLKYLMVRRTRTEIERYYGEDLKKQGLRFPFPYPPTALFYKLNATENRIFNHTIELLQRGFNYTRYAPMLYYKGKMSELERQSQRNLIKFMKQLLVKRLESSFFAFRATIERFIRSYEIFLQLYDDGYIYFSKKHLNKIFDYVEAGNEEAIEKMIEEGLAEKFPASQFKPSIRTDLENDLNTLRTIREEWQGIKRDPKLLEFIAQLKEDKILNESKLIVFTESEETACYLRDSLEIHYPGRVLMFSGKSDESLRKEVIYNFDAKSSIQHNAYRILITTEVLAEGVNLHRSNVVVNYDIPWNPTRMMQRVGRINRVDSKFDTIYTYNFFPSEEGNDAIRLREIAMMKITSFITLLGADSQLLTEHEEIEQHELFNKLNSYQSEEDEGESPLSYLNEIRRVMENDPELFKKISQLPVKAKSAISAKGKKDAVVSYIKKGNLEKFFICDVSLETKELDFLESASTLKCEPGTKRANYDLESLYKFIGVNMSAFRNGVTSQQDEIQHQGSKTASAKLLQQVKFLLKQFTALPPVDEKFLETLRLRLEQGALPKQTVTTAQKAGEAALQNNDAKSALRALKQSIPPALLTGHISDSIKVEEGVEEVILSLYINGK